MTPKQFQVNLFKLSPIEYHDNSKSSLEFRFHTSNNNNRIVNETVTYYVTPNLSLCNVKSLKVQRE